MPANDREQRKWTGQTFDASPPEKQWRRNWNVLPYCSGSAAPPNDRYDDVHRSHLFRARDDDAIATMADAWHAALIVQLASIQTWRRTGGGTIERWNGDNAPPAAYGVSDSKGRLMVVMVHNSDVPDGWEREAEDPEYFFSFSPDAYAVGIDVLLYSMTH